MTNFKPGDPVRTTDGTAATFVALVSKTNSASAIIQVGADTRVVATVSLKQVA